MGIYSELHYSRWSDFLLELWRHLCWCWIWNILKYYYSAMLVAALVWFQPDSDILALEQAESEIPLVDWVTMIKWFRLPPFGIYQTASRLAHVWRQHRENLIPADLLAFFWLKPKIDFSQWQKSGMYKVNYWYLLTIWEIRFKESHPSNMIRYR